MLILIDNSNPFCKGVKFTYIWNSYIQEKKNEKRKKSLLETINNRLSESADLNRIEDWWVCRTAHLLAAKVQFDEKCSHLHCLKQVDFCQTATVHPGIGKRSQTRPFQRQSLQQSELNKNLYI